MPSPTASLSSLPPELMVPIASHLDHVADVASLRLSCKKIEASIFASFAHDYFHVFQVMRSQFSLQTLIDISKSRLAPFVEKLAVDSELLQERDPRDSRPIRRGVVERVFDKLRRHDNSGPPREKALLQSQSRGGRALARCFDIQVGHQQDLLDGRKERDLLVEALAKIRPTAVEVRTRGSTMADGVDRRSRLPPCRRHNGYGMATFLADYGLTTTACAESRGRLCSSCGNQMPSSSDQFCLGSLLYALGKADARPTKLALTAEASWGLCLRTQAPSEGTPDAPRRNVVPVLASLREVHLEIYMHDKSLSNSNRRLCEFVGRLYGLQSLRLDFLCDQDHFDNFFDWLVRSSDASLPQLRHLDARKLIVPWKMMLAVARRLSPTLRSLSLSDVQLTARAPPDMASLNWICPMLPTPWATFLGGLIEFGGNLSTINFSGPVDRLVVDGTESSKRNRYFKVLGDSWSAFSYVGTDAPRALQGLSQSLSRGHDHLGWSPDLRGTWHVDGCEYYLSGSNTLL